MAPASKRHLLYPEWINSAVEEIDLNKHIGFVYLISNIETGQKYIGRKILIFSRSKKIGGRKKKIFSESDWKIYWGSNKEVSSLIKEFGTSMFVREIISLHTDRRDLNFEEVSQQFKRDVLTSELPSGIPEYYNRNIANRYYKRTEESYKIAAEKTSKILKDKYASGELIHPLLGKVHPNKGKKVSSGHDKVNKNKFHFVSPGGDEYCGENVLKFLRENQLFDLDHSSMVKLSSGKRKSYKGWTTKSE